MKNKAIGRWFRCVELCSERLPDLRLATLGAILLLVHGKVRDDFSELAEAVCHITFAFSCVQIVVPF